MMWLAAYYWTPDDHHFITPARKERAKAHFNTLRNVAFLDTPQWNLWHFFAMNETPEHYIYEVACSEDPDNHRPCPYSEIGGNP